MYVCCAGLFVALRDLCYDVVLIVYDVILVVWLVSLLLSWLRCLLFVWLGCFFALFCGLFVFIGGCYVLFAYCFCYLFVSERLLRVCCWIAWLVLLVAVLGFIYWFVVVCLVFSN